MLGLKDVYTIKENIRAALTASTKKNHRFDTKDAITDYSLLYVTCLFDFFTGNFHPVVLLCCSPPAEKTKHKPKKKHRARMSN